MIYQWLQDLSMATTLQNRLTRKQLRIWCLMMGKRGCPNTFSQSILKNVECPLIFPMKVIFIAYMQLINVKVLLFIKLKFSSFEGTKISPRRTCKEGSKVQTSRSINVHVVNRGLCWLEEIKFCSLHAVEDWIYIEDTISSSAQVNKSKFNFDFLW